MPVPVDSCLRSALKTFSYRAMGLFVTGAVAFSVTGRLGFAAAIGLADTLVKLGAYYAHERAWSRIRFGQVQPPEYQI